MSVSKMQKIQLTTTKSSYERVIEILHNSGAVEVERADAEEKDLYKPESKAEYWQTNVKFGLNLLNEHKGEEKKSLKEKLASGKPAVTPEEIAELQENFDYKSMVAELENLDKKYNNYNNIISQSEKEKKNLENWVSLPDFDPAEFKYTKVVPGTIPVTRFEEFKETAANLKEFNFCKINEDNREIFVVAMYLIEATEPVAELFETADFKQVELDLEPGESITQKIKELDAVINENKELATTAEKNIKQYLQHIPKFQILYDYLNWKKAEDEASKKALATKETISLTAWIPGHILTEIESQIDKVTKDYLIEDLEIGEDENIPVTLRNSKAIAPFESVTEIYGAPLYTEPDPTILLAPFFILYFALCLTDAGYGLLLAGLSFVAIKIMKPTGGAKNLMNLMLLGGIMTFIIGALFGGWFGIVIEDLPDGVIKNFAMSVRLINPVENPMTVLVMSFILGFIQMVAGNVIDAYWKIKQGFVMDGLLGGGIWSVFLLIIGFWVAVQAGALPESLGTVATYAVFAGIIALVATQGRDKKNFFLKVGAGIGSLYGLVGYLSDILSYSRLLALGLSTGIIAMVVNLVANLFAGMIPYVGWLVWILIIVGGHLFNLAINVLGAYIHSGRLQFVEYFPKFMVGGGRKFKPLTRTAKYITLNN